MKRTLVLIATCLGAAAWSLGQPSAGGFRDEPSLPDSPAGRRAGELITLINDGSDEALAAFVESGLTDQFKGNSPASVYVDFLKMLHRTHGRLTFHASRRLEPDPAPGTVVAILHSASSDRWLGMMVGTTEQPPFRVTQLMVQPARPPQGAEPSTPLDRAQLVAELDGYLARLAAREAFSGAMLVARGDQVLMARGYGQADRESHRPNRAQTQFALSSIGKVFTAIAIGQLVDAGKLTFDDPVSKHLGREWLPAGAEALTVRQLLNHTGGTGDFLGEIVGSEQRGRYRKVDDYRPLIAGKPLRFPPGTQWEYSNSGFILLGALIEKLSGMDYERYLQQRIWGPAGMKATALLLRTEKNRAAAIGYYRDPDDEPTVWRSSLSLIPHKGSPAGGAYSTVLDMHRLAQALRGGRLLRPSTLAELWRAQSPAGAQLRYGLGFIVSGTEDDRLVGHGGSFPGAWGEFDLFLDRDLVLVALCNGEGCGAARQRAHELLRRLAPGG